MNIIDIELEFKDMPEFDRKIELKLMFYVQLRTAEHRKMDFCDEIKSFKRMFYE